jgi:hypothetical protein
MNGGRLWQHDQRLSTLRTFRLRPSKRRKAAWPSALRLHGFARIRARQREYGHPEKVNAVTAHASLHQQPKATFLSEQNE